MTEKRTSHRNHCRLLLVFSKRGAPSFSLRKWTLQESRTVRYGYGRGAKRAAWGGPQCHVGRGNQRKASCWGTCGKRIFLGAARQVRSQGHGPASGRAQAPERTADSVRRVPALQDHVNNKEQRGASVGATIAMNAEWQSPQELITLVTGRRRLPRYPTHSSAFLSGTQAHHPEPSAMMPP